MKLVTVAEMRAVEKEADASGLTYDQMMENAGQGVAEAILSVYAYGDPESVLGLVGSGNNGGDTLVALSALAEQGWKATAYLVRPRPEKDPLLKRFTDQGGTVVEEALDGSDFPALPGLLEEHAVLLDGVLGTGTRLPLKPEVAGVLEAAKNRLAEMPYPPFVVAVDCPSGVDCDSGAAAPECIPAELTVTMAAVKTGLVSFPAFNLIGDLQVVSIGELDELPAWQGLHRSVVDAEMVSEILPERPPDAHKGTFGTALVVAGSLNYTGAVLLSGEAAYRIGSGLVTLAVPAPLHQALAGQIPEATWLLLPNDMGVISENAIEILEQNLGRATALLVGPGFGLEETTQHFIRRLLKADQQTKHSGMGFLQAETGGKKGKRAELPPLVIDADGLKLLARLPDWPGLLPPSTVLTPHPGEMAILTGLSTDEIQADRMGTAERFAKEWGQVVVLKGALTIIASPDGRTSLIPVATSALARAGTGDVLSGLITGLRAQGLAAYEAAQAGAWIHAEAGLQAASELGNNASVLAGDVLGAVVEVLNDLI